MENEKDKYADLMISIRKILRAVNSESKRIDLILLF